LDSFDKALKVNENEVITFIDKGDTFKEIENTEKAVECYDNALKLVKKSFYGN
jgi:tetratricopeptide (TPR) repeat protein